jgi:hypothetical protein
MGTTYYDSMTILILPVHHVNSRWSAQEAFPAHWIPMAGLTVKISTRGVRTIA